MLDKQFLRAPPTFIRSSLPTTDPTSPLCRWRLSYHIPLERKLKQKVLF